MDEKLGAKYRYRLLQSEVPVLHKAIRNREHSKAFL